MARQHPSITSLCWDKVMTLVLADEALVATPEEVATMVYLPLG
jgi:hypothetical protein